MKLPEQLVLTSEGPAADITVTYDEVQDMVAGSTTYEAPSPQGDLKGAPTYQVANTTSNKGLVRTLAKSKFPQYDSAAEEYVGFDQISTTMNRPETRPVADFLVSLKTHIGLLNKTYVELANAAY